MPCKGLHCGCHGSGGSRGAGLAVVVVLIVIGAAVAKPLERGADTAGRILAVVLKVAVIALAVLAVVAVAAVLGWAGIRVRRRYTNRAAAADRRSLDQPIRVIAEVVEDEPPAIEAPKPRTNPAVVSRPELVRRNR